MSALTSDEAQLIASLNQRQRAMLYTTCELAEINSGSFNPVGNLSVAKKLTELFAPLAEISGTRPLAPIPLISDDGIESNFTPPPMLVFSARPEAPLQLLCTGHCDTVFPKDSHFQKTRIEGNLLHGPGVADMKGGLVVLSEALRAIENSTFREQIGFTVAISPEEEIGSPSSANILAELAAKAHFGLTYEPALGDGTLAGARKGSGNFSCVVRGKSAHAGRDFFQGKNALTAAARLSIVLEELSDEASGISVNIGKISGGGPVNVVPELAVCRFNVRINNAAQQRDVEQRISQCIAEVRTQSGCELSLNGKFNRPPKPLTHDQQAMFDILKACGKQLNLAIDFKPTGGCCEGNNLAAAGLVNIDTLGVRGANIHSDKEYAYIDSFVERAQLSALLMVKLCQHLK